jgi:hypothetical protein
MVRVRNQDEVFDPIVHAVAIEMVNMLRPQQFASEMLLHHMTMLSNVSTVDFQSLVFSRVAPERLESIFSELREVHASQAGSGTELSRLSPILWYVERDSTHDAAQADPLSLSPVYWGKSFALTMPRAESSTGPSRAKGIAA